jgi:protoporphyrin/coproporphyrin ferrochelatase
MKTGVLLVNVGTPDSTSVPDLRKYLRQFLSDERVLDISPVGRWMLVNFIIVPSRSPKSAKMYEEIWTEKGSPLLLHCEKQKQLLQQALGNDFQVELGMAYGNPSIKSALDKFSKPVFKQILVLPLFPQYASATTGSVHQAVMTYVKEWQTIPEILFINNYYNHPLFIKAIAEKGRKHLSDNYDHIIFSFHGLPERQITKADGFNHCLKENCCDNISEQNAFCYRAQCFATARLLAAELSLSSDKFSITFQSRLGKAEWIKPYTSDVLEERARLGDKRLLIFAPAFTSDCLETLFEIGIEYEHLFKSHGGEKIQLVESLNDSETWIECMKDIVLKKVATDSQI